LLDQTALRELVQLERVGLVRQDEGRVVLTRTGRLLANEVAARLMA
jgi:hypothetical protein